MALLNDQNKVPVLAIILVGLFGYMLYTGSGLELIGVPRIFSQQEDWPIDGSRKFGSCECEACTNQPPPGSFGPGCWQGRMGRKEQGRCQYFTRRKRAAIITHRPAGAGPPGIKKPGLSPARAVLDSVSAPSASRRRE